MPTATSKVAPPDAKRAPCRRDSEGERRRECTRHDHGPVRVIRARAIHEHEVSAEPECRDERERHARREPSPVSGFARDEHDANERECDADELERARPLTAREPYRYRDQCGGRRDRRDDAHRTDRHPAIETGEPDRSCEPRGHGGSDRSRSQEVASREGCDDKDPAEAEELRERNDGERREPSRGQAGEEVADPPEHARREGESDCGHAWSTGRVAATASSWFAW
jgi:hypothetical protein